MKIISEFQVSSFPRPSLNLQAGHLTPKPAAHTRPPQQQQKLQTPTHAPTSPAPIARYPLLGDRRHNAFPRDSGIVLRSFLLTIHIYACSPETAHPDLRVNSASPTRLVMLAAWPLLSWGGSSGELGSWGEAWAVRRPFKSPMTTTHLDTAPL